MSLNFPSNPAVGQSYTFGDKSWIWNGKGWITAATNQSSEIYPLDDLSGEFDGASSRFQQKYQGVVINNFNPFRLLVTINGVLQNTYVQDHTWLSMFPRYGLTVDSEGMILFSEPVPAGASFSGRMLQGSNTTNLTTSYPFRPIDILLGA